jgi:hypothetical protein
MFSTADSSVILLSRLYNIVDFDLKTVKRCSINFSYQINKKEYLILLRDFSKVK